jgi:predicted Zn finger-like uncharacterized protein
MPPSIAHQPGGVMLAFDCPHCGRRFEVGDEFAGRKVRCKACQEVFTVPGDASPGGEEQPSAGALHQPPQPAAPTFPPPHERPGPYAPAPMSPQYGGQPAYQPAYFPPPKPGAVTFYLVYLILMIVLYLFVAAMGLLITLMPKTGMDPQDVQEMQIVGPVYLVAGIVFAIPFIVGLFINKGKAAWIYGIVMIAIGLTSCVCWPVSIPLLVFWLQDPTRRYYYGLA